MGAASAARLATYALRLVVALPIALAAAPDARAIEAFDGRLQVHGFGEIQMRGISSNFSEEFDLAQWYNVLNLEIEFDVASNGWGPTDLIEAFVRLEGRYDCVWTRGCGMLRSADVYGDRSRKLPTRLRNALDVDFSGSIPITEPGVKSPPPDLLTVLPVPRIGNTRLADIPPRFSPKLDVGTGLPLPPYVPDNNPPPGFESLSFVLEEPIPREGFPGFDTLFSTRGADNIQGDINPRFVPPNPLLTGTFAFSDDPAFCTFNATIGSSRPPCQLDLQRPFQNRQMLADAGIIDPDEQDAILDLVIDPNDPDPEALAVVEEVNARLDPADQAVLEAPNRRRRDFGFALLDFRGAPGSAETLPVGPFRPDNRIGRPDIAARNNANALLIDRANPFRGGFAGTTHGYRGNPQPNLPGGDPLDPALVYLKDELANGATPAEQNRVPALTTLFQNDTTGDAFAGDWSGIVPCRNPSDVGAERGRTGQEPVTNCYPNIERIRTGQPSQATRDQPFTNVVIALETGRGDFVAGSQVGSRPGGTGELPFRPAPDLPSLAPVADNPGLQRAQGLYIPSQGLREALASGDLDELDFNFDQLGRSFNRGQAQQQTGELKEAYVDIEWLDSRLWTRIGKQNIVWGKTELFRTTDQFNPQDFALASLPSFEESRIALWAFRGVYSLYNVGPLEDVRLEFAFNFDEFQPNDLGAAGEPFTPDLVGGLTTGLFFHSVTGVGVAGIDRPPDPWEDIRGLEIGGRIEFRWDRFSFAITDFYGFNDFPFIDRIWSYQRLVNLDSGRPLVGRPLPPDPDTALDPFYSSVCATPRGEIGVRADGSGGSGDVLLNQFDNLPAGQSGPRVRGVTDSKNVGAYAPAGVGADPDCLKSGGAAGFAGADVVFQGAENALEFHHANQQIFAWICSLTVGIGAAIDPGACAWNIFGSPTPLAEGFSDLPLGEVISALSAGDPSGGNISFTRTVADSTKGNAGALVAPLAPMNRDPGPDLLGATPEEAARWDGVITASSGSINRSPDSPDYQVTLLGTTFTVPCNDNRGDDSSIPFFTVIGGPCRQFSFHHDGGGPGVPLEEIDLLTLDSSLSSAQKALLGCGPFYGTRCDSSDRVQFIASGQSFNSFDEIAAATLDVFPADGGGIDVLNMEASALLQAWPGIEGTAPLTEEEFAPEALKWQTFGTRRQPGTAQVLAFDGTPDSVYEQRDFGPTCTRPDGRGGLIILPGCRGIEAIFVERDPVTRAVTAIEASFDTGYDPGVDGCLFGNSRRASGGVVMPSAGAVGRIGDVDVTLRANADGEVPEGGTAAFQPCFTNSTSKLGTYRASDSSKELTGAGTLWHPLAGCLSDARAEQLVAAGQSENVDARDGTNFAPCGNFSFPDGAGGTIDFAREFADRFAGEPVCRQGGPTGPIVDCDLGGTGIIQFDVEVADLDGNDIQDIEDEFLGNFNLGFDPSTGQVVSVRVGENPSDLDIAVSQAQIFRTELAAASWNFLGFLVVSSCNTDDDGPDVPNPAVFTGFAANPDCFNPERPFDAEQCSYNAPHLCRNVKGFLSVAGVNRNTVRAGGNGQFGRRDFIWHSGGEIALAYEKRNVFGVSMDFAEDVSKSNWGIEFTWIEGLPFTDADSISNVTRSDVINLTVSVDRPTFVNFLNANRTFFINSQWFFQYVTNHSPSFNSNGPWNILFTFAIFTGYFQDRLLPTFVSVFDVQSGSGGILPNISYRFTEAFSATLGMNVFFGNTQLTAMPVNGIGPTTNRAPLPGNPGIAYLDGVDNVLAAIRRRDEVYLRLRWTF